MNITSIILATSKDFVCDLFKMSVEFKPIHI